MSAVKPRTVLLTGRAAFRRLGLKVRAVTSKRTTVAGRTFATSRLDVDGMPWLHLVPVTQVSVHNRSSDVRLVASLLDRLPVMAVMANGEIDVVRMEGWVFAALIRMLETCDPKHVQTIISEYLQLAPNLTQIDRAIGLGILSELAKSEQSLSSISNTGSS